MLTIKEKEAGAMNTRKIRAKISVFLIFMLIFLLPGSSLIYASDTESNSETGEHVGFASNLLEAVKSFVDNIKSLFGVDNVETTEEDGESEDEEEIKDEVEGEEGPGNGHKFGEEISNIAQGLKTGDSTVDELVEKATSIHLQVLEEVYGKVPQAAEDAILRAMENSMKGNTTAKGALNKEDNSDNGNEDEGEIEDKGEGSSPKAGDRGNASERGRQMRNNNPSNR
jgi:hypothetical protein